MALGTPLHGEANKQYKQRIVQKEEALTKTRKEANAGIRLGACERTRRNRTERAKVAEIEKIKMTEERHWGEGRSWGDRAGGRYENQYILGSALR